MSYNGKNYMEQGGDKWVIGGTLEIKEGASVTGLPAAEVPQAANQADSVAEDVSTLVSDFNGLLAKLKAALLAGKHVVCEKPLCLNSEQAWELYQLRKEAAGMDTLLEKVKANLILEHSADDALLQNYITAAVSYAESYQHIQEGYYTENAMPATTEQAVIMLASHFYESRDGSTGGFFADNTNAAQQVWNTVNLLLRLDREWKV